MINLFFNDLMITFFVASHLEDFILELFLLVLRFLVNFNILLLKLLLLLGTSCKDVFETLGLGRLFSSQHL